MQNKSKRKISPWNVKEKKKKLADIQEIPSPTKTKIQTFFLSKEA